MTATETLYRRGAHFVLTGALNDPKRPLWRAWQAPKCGRPSLEVVNAHLAQSRPLGLIPWSLHETVVDIDAGDPDAWVRDNPPRLAVPSRRPGRTPLLLRRHPAATAPEVRVRRTSPVSTSAPAPSWSCGMTPQTDSLGRSNAPGGSRSPATCSRRPASSPCCRSRSSA